MRALSPCITLVVSLGCAGDARSGAPSYSCGDFPSLRDDVAPIFERTCGASDSSCHGPNKYLPQADEDCRGTIALQDVALGSIYLGGFAQGEPSGCPDRSLDERLRMLDAQQCGAFDPRIRYVVPCEPESSYLYRKVAGGPYCTDANGDLSRAMPLLGEMPPDERRTLEDWILAGAPEPCADAVGCDGR